MKWSSFLQKNETCYIINYYLERGMKMNLFKRLFLHSYKKYIVLSILALAIILYYVLFFGATKVIVYVNAFFLAGAILIALGGLSIVTNQGAFDMFQYSGRTFGNMFRRNINPVRKETYAEFLEEQKEKRVKKKYAFGPYIFIGVILLIISVSVYTVANLL